jgi:hypothetical protein
MYGPPGTVEAFGGFSEVGCGKVREALCIVIPFYVVGMGRRRHPASGEW